MVGSPPGQRPREPSWRPRRASCPKNLGLRRGLGRIFGWSEGVTVYAAARRSSLLGIIGRGATVKMERMKKRREGWKEKEPPSGGGERGHRGPRRFSCQIAFDMKIAGVERRRNAPPPCLMRTALTV